jgi:hypothetical protein
MRLALYTRLDPDLIFVKRYIFADDIYLIDSKAGMDTEVARTFLVVIAAGNFSAAAERLFVTQSTVSARIRSPEDSLGCALFVRNKAGTTLTPAGRQFQNYAASLVRTCEEVRQTLSVQSGFHATLTIGDDYALCVNVSIPANWYCWSRRQVFAAGLPGIPDGCRTRCVHTGECRSARSGERCITHCDPRQSMRSNKPSPRRT